MISKVKFYHFARTKFLTFAISNLSDFNLELDHGMPSIIKIGITVHAERGTVDRQTNREYKDNWFYLQTLKTLLLLFKKDKL